MNSKPFNDMNSTSSLSRSNTAGQLSVQIPTFLNYCKCNKRLNSKTIKAYRIDLKQFQNNWEDYAPHVNNITCEGIESFISFLHETYKPRTVKRKIASIKAFCHYLEYRGLITVNPFNKIDITFREPTTLPKTIPLSIIEQLLTEVYKEKSNGFTARKRDNAIRDAAVLELLFATGLRISELCDLTLNTVDIPNRTILINGKGTKERILRIENDSVLSTLKAYYDSYEEEILANRFFFVNRNGTRLSDQAVRRMIRHYSALANICLHITPHMFRHTFASSLLDEGVDIRNIQEFLGHSSISVTEIYTHVSLSRQKEILSTKHPRNKMTLHPITNTEFDKAYHSG